jgi:hypothetical protein
MSPEKKKKKKEEGTLADFRACIGSNVCQRNATADGMAVSCSARRGENMSRLSLNTGDSGNEPRR